MPKLTIEQCYKLVDDKVFPYLSSEYSKENSEEDCIEVEMLICKIADEKEVIASLRSRTP